MARANTKIPVGWRPPQHPDGEVLAWAFYQAVEEAAPVRSVMRSPNGNVYSILGASLYINVFVNEAGLFERRALAYPMPYGNLLIAMASDGFVALAQEAFP